MGFSTKMPCPELRPELLGNCKIFRSGKKFSKYQNKNTIKSTDKYEMTKLRSTTKSFCMKELAKIFLDKTENGRG